MKEIIVLVGNIGTGKSTLTKEYQAKGYVVIARDTIRYAIGGGKYVFNLDYEPIVQSIENHMLEEFLEFGVNVIVDEVGVSKIIRGKYLTLGEIWGYKVTCIELKKLSKKECVDRRMINPHGTFDRKIWENVWDTFDNMYEHPSLDEGFNEIIHL